MVIMHAHSMINGMINQIMSPIYYTGRRLFAFYRRDFRLLIAGVNSLKKAAPNPVIWFTIPVDIEVKHLLDNLA